MIVSALPIVVFFLLCSVLSAGVKGTVVAIAGPSGVGKGTLMHGVLHKHPDMQGLCALTTRPKRPHEAPDQWRCFVTEQAFKQEIQKGRFLAYAQIYGYWYGQLLEPFEKGLHHHQKVMCEIHARWLQNIHRYVEKKPDLELISVLVLPPTLAVLKQRLYARNRDAVDVMTKRLESAIEDMEHYQSYRYVVINDHEEKTVALLNRIIDEHPLLPADCPEAFMHEHAAVLMAEKNKTI